MFFISTIDSRNVFVHAIQLYLQVSRKTNLTREAICSAKRNVSHVSQIFTLEQNNNRMNHMNDSFFICLHCQLVSLKASNSRCQDGRNQGAKYGEFFVGIAWLLERSRYRWQLDTVGTPMSVSRIVRVGIPLWNINVKEGYCLLWCSAL